MDNRPVISEPKNPRMKLGLTENELGNIHSYVARYKKFLTNSSGQPVGKFDPWCFVTE